MNSLEIARAILISSFKYFIEKLKLRGREYTMFNEDKEYKLVEERKNNKGFSFSKFFGYFFEKEE